MNTARLSGGVGGMGSLVTAKIGLLDVRGRIIDAYSTSMVYRGIERRALFSLDSVRRRSFILFHMEV